MDKMKPTSESCGEPMPPSSEKNSPSNPIEDPVGGLSPINNDKERLRERRIEDLKKLDPNIYPLY